MNLEPFCSRIKLVGLEPQVKWATSIRKKKLEAWKAMTFRHLIMATKPHLTDANFKAMGCVTDQHIVAFLWAVAKHSMSCPKAQWWMQHRDDHIASWLPHSIKECVAHFSKTKPFK